MGSNKARAFRDAVEGQAKKIEDINHDAVSCAKEVRSEVSNLEIDFDWANSGPVILVSGSTESVKRAKTDIENIVGKYGLRFQTDLSFDVDYECQLSIKLIKGG